jgi:transposase
MVDVEFIRKKHLIDGWSIRKISRHLDLARQTVRKVLGQSEPPRYWQRQPRPCPAMDPYVGVIEGWLAADTRAPRKQQHTAKRIYDRLVEEHQFGGAESTVRRYVARLRARPTEVFIPLTAAWGQQAQVDWGQATVRIAGTAVVAHLFCLRLRASGVAFTWAAPTEKLEAFLDGHCRAFAWFGGVPAECLYDNPKTAVVRILAGPLREEHTLFASLRAHYLFESLFCRPAQAHEKGAVENLVGYVRRNALVPVPDFPSWDALNAHLLAWCVRERAGRRAAWEQEARHLRPVPIHPFRPALVRLTAVSRLSLVTIDHNRYSVPCAYVGQTVHVAIFTERIEIYRGDLCLARHLRCYQRGQTVLDLPHYLPAFAAKPHAVRHAAVIDQIPPIYATVRDVLCRARPDGYREFAAILLLHREFAAGAVTAALADAHARGCLQATAVRQLVLNQTSTVCDPITVPASLAHVRLPLPDLAHFNTLLAGVTA